MLKLIDVFALFLSQGYTWGREKNELKSFPCDKAKYLQEVLAECPLASFERKGL